MIVRKNIKYTLLLAFLLIQITAHIQAQNVTRIWGTVADSKTGEPLPFVNISFAGTTLGTVSSSEGKFYIETDNATASLKASFIGYEPQIISVKINESQKVNFKLKETSLQLENVTVKGKKLRYRNKNNPAVALMKKVIQHREENRTENLDFLEYDKYEKVEFDFNNITEKFRNKKIMKNFQMVFDYVDTSEVNGKTYLPIFIRETSSKIYYRKQPQKEIEYRQGQKMTGFHDYLNNQGISMLIDKMYQEVDIYDNNINVLTQKFVSPISGLAPVTYKYYIADTLEIEGEKLYKLAFQPRNENNLAFVGNLFITTDSAYAVKKVSMRISKKINLNYVNDLFIDQEFEKTDAGSYIIKVDKISIDFDIPGKLDMYGKRTVSFKDRVYNVPREDKIYSDLQNVIEVPDVRKKDDQFWEEARHMELSKSEKGVYKMVEEVKELPAFKRMMDILFLITIGYKDFGPFSLGPVNTFYSWNDVEGFRLRLGGQTNDKFSEKFQIKAYGAYGFRDKEWKYSTEFFYFRNKNPLDAFKFTYQDEIRNPGEELMFVQEDNFLLSFKRGVNNKQIYNKKVQFEYMKELKHGISYTIGIKKLDMRPGGILSFAPGVRTITDEFDFTPKEQRDAEVLRTSELNLSLRIAPNEQYYEGIQFRVPIYNKHPIFTIKYDKGFENVFDSPFSYDKVSLGIFKRTYVPPFGYFDAELEGNRIWGQVPYPLLNVPRANQTFSYQIRSYNLMNFLEFVSDRFISLQYAHYFNGYFLNKIPLLKKLKWRSIITFKGIVGSVSDLNNPSLHPDILFGYPVDENGIPVTSALDHYLETSIGVGNIFKIFRVDLVKRWTQLDQPGIAGGYNIRGRFKIEF